jgi:FkbM family methyltransferase
MTLSKLFTLLFEKFPEGLIKNRLRYFLAFNSLIPASIQNLSPIKGYELHRRIKKGDIIIDAGAFTGDYTIFAAKKAGKEGKVIAFEPDFKNREILFKNIKKERLENVTVIPKGLWSKRTTLNFNSLDGLHSNLDKEGNITIEVTPLDEEINKLNLPKIDIIKMDIEGAEIEAVKGCIKIIKKYSPFFKIASYHKLENKETSIFLEKFFKRYKYKVITDFPTHKTTFAWKD